MAPKPRSALLLALAVLACLLLPFLFWHASWFGRSLTDEELERYLRDEERPRRIQHALTQIAQRLERGDDSVARWYGQVAALGRHPLMEIRSMAAWVMGREARSLQLRERLASMLADPELLVRRNAALALVRFADPRGREEILSMLQPYVMRSPAEGRVNFMVEEGESVERRALLARQARQDGTVEEVRAPLSGTVGSRLVPQQSQVRAGAGMLELWPQPEQVWEALRALYLVGQEQDLEIVQPFVGDVRFSERIRQQARLTVRAIEERAKEPKKKSEARSQK